MKKNNKNNGTTNGFLIFVTVVIIFLLIRNFQLNVQIMELEDKKYELLSENVNLEIDNNYLDKQNDELTKELLMIETKEENQSKIVPTVKKETPKYRSLGMFNITYYCKEDYPHICNDGNPKVTATGTTPTANRTIAVDPNKIPLGSTVKINGQEYIAEDTGGAIKNNRIDILVDTHDEALENGKQEYEVFIKE